jgi:hypothetical protein
MYYLMILYLKKEIGKLCNKLNNKKRNKNSNFCINKNKMKFKS